MCAVWTFVSYCCFSSCSFVSTPSRMASAHSSVAPPFLSGSCPLRDLDQSLSRCRRLGGLTKETTKRATVGIRTMNTTRLNLQYFANLKFNKVQARPFRHITFEALHSASPELHLTLYEFESASDVIQAMLNVVPHLFIFYLSRQASHTQTTTHTHPVWPLDFPPLQS